MEYCIIKSWSLPEIELEVTNYLKNGWKLQGGVALLWDGNDSKSPICYAQALYKED